MQKRDRESQQGEQPEQEEAAEAKEKSPASDSPPIKKKPTAAPSAVDASDAPSAAEVPTTVADTQRSAAAAPPVSGAAAAAELPKKVWFKFGETVSSVQIAVGSDGDDLIENIVKTLRARSVLESDVIVSVPDNLTAERVNKLREYCNPGTNVINPSATLDGGFFTALGKAQIVVTSVAVKVRLDHTVVTIEGLRLGSSTVGDLKFQAVRVLSVPHERAADYSLFFDTTQPTIIWGSAGSAAWLDKFCEGIPAASADLAAAEKSPRKLKGDATLDQDFFRVVKGNVEVTLVDERSPPAPIPTVLVSDKYNRAPAKHFQFNIDECGSDLFRSVCDFFLPGADSQNVGQLQLVAEGDWPALSCFVPIEGKLYLDRGAVLDQAFANAASWKGNSLVLVHHRSPALSPLHFVNVNGLGAKSGRSEKQIYVKVDMPVWEVLSRIRFAFGPSKRNDGAYDLVLPNEFARPLEMEDAAWEEFLRCFRPRSTLKPDSKLTQEFISVFSSPGGSCLQAFIHAIPFIADSQTQALSKVPLYDREESAFQMFKAFMVSPGRSAPSLGQSFGAGKSQLSFRFREFAEKPEFLAKLKTNFTEFSLLNDLLGAVYVSVISGNWKTATNEANLHDRLQEAEKKLNISLFQATGMPCNTLEERRAMQEVLGRKILLHFDEVQLFENEKDAGTLFGFWDWVVQRAAEFGNLYILSGRSQWLRLMGQNLIFPGKPSFTPISSASFQLYPIGLPLLSEDSIKKMLPENWNQSACGISLFKRYSAGVPRLVFDVRLSLRSVSPPTTREEIDQLFQKIGQDEQFYLRKQLEPRGSLKLWDALASAAWARVVLSANLFIEDEGVARTVPDAISYAGFYCEEADGGFIVRAPLWSFVVNRPQIAKLATLANTGDRLEGGVSSVFSMRLLLSQPRNWRDLGLAVLEEQGVPFNFKEVSLVLLPKIFGDDSKISEAKKLAAKAKKAAAKAEKATAKAEKSKSKKSEAEKAAAEAAEVAAKAKGKNDDHARACATVFESKTRTKTESIPEQAAQEVSWTIHRDSFHIFCEALKLGVFHRFIPQSSFADGANRVGDRHLFCTQEKNFTKPISKDAVLDEMKKCRVEGFTVTLLIICTAGHTSFNGFETDKDAIVEDSNCVGVKAIVLSRQSVINFLGLHFIDAAQSRTLQHAAFTEVPDIPLTQSQ